MNEEKENKRITIEDKNGETLECDVIEEFMSERNNKKYMIYTSNKEVEEDNVEIYASLVDESGDIPVLTDLITEEDKEIVSAKIEELYTK